MAKNDFKLLKLIDRGYDKFELSRLRRKSLLYCSHCAFSDFVALTFVMFEDSLFPRRGIRILVFLPERQKIS